MANTRDGKRFSSKSNVRRAAREDGLELDQINVMQDGAQFYYTVKATQTEGEQVEQDQPEDVIEDTDTNARLLELVGGESYGPVSEVEANRSADELAASAGCTIHVKDMLTGEAIYTADAPEKTAEGVTEVTGVGDGAAEGTGEVYGPMPEGDDTLRINPEAGRPVMLAIEVSTAVSAELAGKIAKLLGMPVTIAECIGLEVLNTIEPKVRAVREPKPAGEGGVKARKEAPDGKKALVLELCSRETGASPAELITATGWTKAPWKWMLSSDPKNNLCSEYGYEYAESKDGRNVRYLLTKNEAPAMSEAA